MFNVCILPHVMLLLHNNYAIISQRNLYRVNLRSLITPCPCLIIFALYETFLRSNEERRESGREAKDWAFSINLFARERLFLSMIYGFSIDESLPASSSVRRVSHVSLHVCLGNKRQHARALSRLLSRISN